jgi:O-acetyl-ADP-ribose deacetylase (regulator of RNase III)
MLVAHVVNDRGGWGKGFVLAVSKHWPQAEEDYRDWAKSGRRGGESPTPFQLGEVLISKVETNLSVAHLLAQHGYIAPDNPTPLSYEALTQCLRRLASIAAAQNASIHMPRIGAGLGGGDWPRIRQIVEQEVGHLAVYIYAFR